jgi:hypothetical protein
MIIGVVNVMKVTDVYTPPLKEDFPGVFITSDSKVATTSLVSALVLLLPKQFAASKGTIT